MTLLIVTGVDKPNIILLFNQIEEAVLLWNDLGKLLLMNGLTSKTDVIGEEYKGVDKICYGGKECKVHDERCCKDLFASLNNDFEAEILQVLKHNICSVSVPTVNSNDSITG